MKNEMPKVTFYSVYDEFVSVLGLRANELHVYAAIYNAVAHMKGYISFTQITKKTGVTRTRVCQIVKSLEERGFIARTSNKGRRRKNNYILKSVTVARDGTPQFPGRSSVNTAHFEKKAEQNYSYMHTRTSVKPLLPI